jgi:hypothetical protein
MRELNFNTLEAPVRLHVLERMETSRRQQVAFSHDVIGGLAHEDPAAIGGPAYQVVADWLHTSYTESPRPTPTRRPQRRIQIWHSSTALDQ